MKEQILKALKAKFQGVNATILDRIATMLAKTVTEESQVTTAVEGVTQEWITLVESYGDTRATEAQRTAVQNYETKYGLKEGKPAEPADPNDPKNQKPQQGDNVPEWAKQLIDQNKALSERLNKLDSERTSSSRKQELEAIYAKLPENLRKPYQRISVEGLKDEEFTALKAELTQEIDGTVADLKAKGAVFGRPGGGGNGGDNQGKLTEEQKKAIEARPGSEAKDGQPF